MQFDALSWTLKEVIRMTLHNVREYRDYRLPPEFWNALVDVRNYLYSQEDIVDRIYSPDLLNDDLRAAFCFVDTIVDEVVASDE